MEQAGVADPVNLTSGQEAEAAEFGNGPNRIFFFAINGVDRTAAAQKGLFKFACALPAEKPVTDNQVYFGRFCIHRLQKGREFVPGIHGHDGLHNLGAKSILDHGLVQLIQFLTFLVFVDEFVQDSGQ